MNVEFIKAINVLQEEKQIDKEELFQAIELSICNAYKKTNSNHNDNIMVHIDRETGDMDLIENLNIVDFVEDENLEISIWDAQDVDPGYQLGDVFIRHSTPQQLGRIAARNARQLIMQKIQEHERNMLFEKFVNLKDELVSSIVQRQYNDNVIVDLGDTTAIMRASEQISNESYDKGKRLKVYVVNVSTNHKGAQISVSRTHPGLVKRLFELEVPEIHRGLIDIIAVSREAGFRSKIAVQAVASNIDPIGACVGPKGLRVQNILNDLGNEKIDIIEYSKDVSTFIANALSPAKVQRIIVSKSDKKAIAIVEDSQQSLAIGREGQNVRLAAKLTNWKIDIKSESKFNELIAEEPDFEKEFIGETVVEKTLDEVLEISIDNKYDDALDQLIEDSNDENIDDDDIFSDF